MDTRTQTSMRLKTDTLEKLKILKKKTGLSMARVLALIVDDYIKGEVNGNNKRTRSLRIRGKSRCSYICRYTQRGISFRGRDKQ